MLPPVDLNNVKEKLSSQSQLHPWQRSFQFWVRLAYIYTGHKRCFNFQVRVSFQKDMQKQEAMWERQHQLAADKTYHLCTHIGGFFLKCRKILKSLPLAYGQMILKSGFFHADPHPGNNLICKGSEVALLDYGQVKDLPEKLRSGYANLVHAIADGDSLRASKSFRY